jgi:hypothetical protein
MVTEGQALLIPSNSEGERILVYPTESIKIFCGENSNRDYSVTLLVVYGVAFVSWSDVNGDFSHRNGDADIS